MSTHSLTDKTADSGSADGGSIPLGYAKLMGISVASFFRERKFFMGFVNNFIKKLKTEKQFAKMFYIAAAAFVLAVVIIIVCVSCSKDDEAAAEDGAQQESVADGEVAEETTEETAEPLIDYTVPDVPVEENAYPEVNDLVAKYFNAMSNGDKATIESLRDTTAQEELIKIEKESAYIDGFENIKVYTKPGPMEGSYVTFVSYEIKFSGIDTVAPGLTTFYLCPKEDGSLYICDGNRTQQDTDYVKAIVAQADVADIFSRVQTKYAEAMDADAALSEFMAGLSEKLDAEVSQAMAQVESESTEVTEEQPQEQPQEQSQAVEELVKATDTVNVRASDSENADRIGRVAMGETVTRYEKKENGWSRVDYNGTEGYIKSEYLEVVGGSDNQTQESEPEEEPAEQEEQEDAPTTDLTSKGTVTIKEAVNIRKSASTSADKLGMAYKGETYELIMEQADGWCKIKYKGEVGYVKTEFVE